MPPPKSCTSSNTLPEHHAPHLYRNRQARAPPQFQEPSRAHGTGASIPENGQPPDKTSHSHGNALVLEQKLHAGEFRSLAYIRMTYGITRMELAKALNMHNHTPEEISTILRETY